ncbi:MAG: class I SAM-dependent methyltransferase, partial [Terracidiphilus sp.]
MRKLQGQNRSSVPVYDKIGVDYSLRRKADPQILDQIEKALSSCATVLNVGAGTGSYEPPACTLAVEPSQEMIDQRSRGSALCIRGTAEQLPLEDRSFDGTLASLTIHHWDDVEAGLIEMQRVARKKVVLFTWDPESESDFWLTRGYFPAMLERDQL